MLFLKEYKEELIKYVTDNKKLFGFFSNKSILISGAAGLIGSYITDLFMVANEVVGTNSYVYAVDKNRELLERRFPKEYSKFIKIQNIDINKDELPNLRADYIIHAASNTSPSDYAKIPVDTIRTNIIGTDRLIQYAVSCKSEKFIFCSSVEAYGMNNGDVEDFTEDYSGYVNCNTLRAGYPSAKRASEALCNAYATQCDDFNFVIARIGRIYGPTVIAGDTKAPTQFIRNAVNGENIIMKSNGLQEYSYAYVGDCAIAIIMLISKGKNGEAYNIADPNSKILLRNFAEFSAKAGKTKVEFDCSSDLEKLGYSKITKATMNVDKLIELGWKPLYNTEDGIKRTVEYLKKLKGI